MNTNLKILIRLKNASMARKEKITLKNPTTFVINVLAILYNEGLIQSFILDKVTSTVTVLLRYSYNKDIFKNLKIFSKATTLSYFTYSDICKLSNKRFLLVFSTTKGFLTGLECKKQRLGGKLCFIC
jgi:ribosomal protein S8